MKITKESSNEKKTLYTSFCLYEIGENKFNLSTPRRAGGYRVTNEEKANKFFFK